MGNLLGTDKAFGISNLNFFWEVTPNRFSFHFLKCKCTPKSLASRLSRSLTYIRWVRKAEMLLPPYILYIFIRLESTLKN